MSPTESKEKEVTKITDLNVDEFRKRLGKNTQGRRYNEHIYTFVYVIDNLGEVACTIVPKKGSTIVLDPKVNLCGIFTTTDALNVLVEIFYPMANLKSSRCNSKDDTIIFRLLDYRNRLQLSQHPRVL